jgi:DNA helicase-2/ATP-dependent DNA helicase PcrA
MDFYESLFTYCGYRFNENQQLAISHLEGPALTLAVPGSGKTTLLLARTVCLVKEGGIPPSKILTMTFSKAAAKDMEERYRARYYPHYKYDLNFGTIHSFSYRVLKAWRKRRNLPLSLVDADGPSKLEILAQI